MRSFLRVRPPLIIVLSFRKQWIIFCHPGTTSENHQILAWIFRIFPAGWTFKSKNYPAIEKTKKTQRRSSFFTEKNEIVHRDSLRNWDRMQPVFVSRDQQDNFRRFLLKINALAVYYSASCDMWTGRLFRLDTYVYILEYISDIRRTVPVTEQCFFTCYIPKHSFVRKKVISFLLEFSPPGFHFREFGHVNNLFD